MKYETKRSKVEEVVIDLEDGCVLKLTRENIVDFNMAHVNNHLFEGCFSYSHTEISISFKNGISYELETKDKKLIADLEGLFHNANISIIVV